MGIKYLLLGPLLVVVFPPGITPLTAESRSGSLQNDRVLVRGGTFRMGTSASEIPKLKLRYTLSFRGAFEDEIPDHTVTVSDFQMDRYEVTNDRFSQFLAAHSEWSRALMPPRLHNGHYLDDWKDGNAPPGRKNHPVRYVTWHAAQAFCVWSGGRLPTESEWEYAARGRRDREFPWGDEPASARRANYSASGFGDTQPVGAYPPSPFGLYDLAGNVWEFTLDAWRPGYPSDRQVDPVVGGTIANDLRSLQGRTVIRGGSFGGAPVNLRTRWRDSHEVSNAVAFVGFRCAYPAQPSKP